MQNRKDPITISGEFVEKDCSLDSLVQGLPGSTSHHDPETLRTWKNMTGNLPMGLRLAKGSSFRDSLNHLKVRFG
jgi:hypothetical protein